MHYLRYFSATMDTILILIVLLSSLGVDGYFYSSEEGGQKSRRLDGDKENWLVKRMNKISCHCCANSFNSHCCIQCMQRVGKRSEESNGASNPPFEDIANVMNEENTLLENSIPIGRTYRLVKEVNHLFQMSPSEWK